MEFNPKFKTSDPKTKEEKLIVEYMNNLHDVSIAHVRLNIASCNTQEIFITLRDGAIGFAGKQIEALMRLLADTSQMNDFIEEAESIFKSYLKQAVEEINKY